MIIIANLSNLLVRGKSNFIDDVGIGGDVNISGDANINGDVVVSGHTRLVTTNVSDYMSVHLATFDGISVDDIADCVLTNCKMVNANRESGSTDPAIMIDLKSTLYDGQNILPFLTIDTSHGHASVQGVTSPRQLSILSTGVLTLNHPYNIEIIRSDGKIYYPVLSQ